jgi:hypothetical protein
MTILVAVFMAGVTPRAVADIFDASSAGLLLENTIPDLDLALMTSFSGTILGSTLNYGGTISSAGFMDFLQGSYAGNVVNITYTSTDLANYSGPGVTWTTSGNYGGQNWVDTGSAAFSFP